MRFRLATVRIGCVLTVIVGAAGLVYFGATWHEGHRPGLVALTAALIAGAVAVALAPMQRIIAGRWRETFFFTWTLANVAGILALAALDPANPSPMALPLFMPLLFAGMSYPREVALACAVMVPASYVAVALATGEDTAYASFFTLCLCGAAAMCLWQVFVRERQRAELDRQRDELARVSRSDPLTGALNRRGFEERLAAELAAARRSGVPFTLAMLDLDRFKQLNDSHGHAAGDEILRCTVARLQNVLRAPDDVGRIGGDEFALLLGGVGEDRADAVLARLREAIGDIAACLGHACFPDDGETADDLFRVADEALYRAKADRVLVTP